MSLKRSEKKDRQEGRKRKKERIVEAKS